MSRHIRFMALGIACFFTGVRFCSAQYGTAPHVRVQLSDQIRAAIRTLLLQVDHMVEDMEIDLVREPLSERLLLTADEVRDEVEHLAVSAERGAELDHIGRDFQEFDAAWHRFTRQAARYAADDRHLQRNVARIGQTDSELHRLLRIPAPVNIQEVRALTARLHRAARQLRQDLAADLLGVRRQHFLLVQTDHLEEAAEHLEFSIAQGVDVLHMRRDFEAIDEAWQQLAGGLRELSSMRFDHVLRGAAAVATAEGQLRAALGLEPNPDQFTCFRPPPSELRRTLPYAGSGNTVMIPSGWKITALPHTGPQPPQRNAGFPPDSNNDDLSLILGFMFGMDPREPKGARPQSRRSDGDAKHGRDHDHDEGDADHERERERTQPAIKKIGITPPPTRTPNAAAPVPPKPVDAANQAKVEKNAASPAKIERNLARLSPENRAAAEAQRTCPVSGELLGSHGTPIKVKLKGKNDSGNRREVFVCCDDCEDELEDHPEKYRDRIAGHD